MLLDIVSCGRLNKPAHYAVMYTAGNVIAVIGTLFLAGPRRQARRMAGERRLLATCIFVISMALTLFVAWLPPLPRGPKTVLVLALVFVQWLALVWYGLSYIPFGRQVAVGCLRRFCCSEDDE